MTVMLEGVSLVFENRVLNAQCLGGMRAFRVAWDNGSFCSDGTISRLSFFESDDAFCMLTALPDCGLDFSFDFATDVAVFLYGGIPAMPCLWLETPKTRQKIQICWHATETQGDKVVAPKYYRKEATLARYGHMDEDAVMEKITRLDPKGGQSLFQDSESKRVFAGPGPLRRH